MGRAIHPAAVDKARCPGRAGGVKGGGAAERSKGTLDAAEHVVKYPVDGAEPTR